MSCELGVISYFKSQILELKLPAFRPGHVPVTAGPEPARSGLAGRYNLQFLFRRLSFSVLLMNAYEEVQKY